MKKWKEFEIQCTDYLNERFGMYAEFIHQGGADSTVADILVKTKTGHSFYIDVKHVPAHCGQFVLLPNFVSRTFEYSPRNVNCENEYAKHIIQYMNVHFDDFREVGTVGRVIDLPDGKEIFTNWIIRIYQEKGVRLFIINDYKILDFEHFKECFDVQATYRIKRSGSANVCKREHHAVMEYLATQNITDFQIEAEKLFAVSSKQLHYKRFIVSGVEYMLSRRGDVYEIRRLSNTYNANVIFSIKCKTSTRGLSDTDFIDYLLFPHLKIEYTV